LKRNWNPTPQAFAQLLAWLDEGTDSGGERYLATRRRLVSYFSRKNCRTPDDLADETLNRVARRLEEEGGITDAPPAQFCYITARFVFLEHLRSFDRKVGDLSGGPDGHPIEPSVAPAFAAEPQAPEMDCLDRCLQMLTQPDRDLLLGYYSGNGRERIDGRKALAERLRVTVNALTIKASRLRAKLEICVRDCVQAA
jgi:DNA-directed RNA polymerase specialized sigma24 family protein